MTDTCGKKFIMMTFCAHADVFRCCAWLCCVFLLVRSLLVKRHCPLFQMCNVCLLGRVTFSTFLFLVFPADVWMNSVWLRNMWQENNGEVWYRLTMATYLFHRSGLKHYSAIRLLMLRVKFDGIWRRTPELKHLPWTAFIRCIWNTLFPIKAPFTKKMLLFWSLHFSSAFFHKISLNVSRNMLKIQTESYFHLTMSKWPISTANCRTKRFFTVFGTLLVTWRQRKEIPSPTHPHTYTPLQNRECFVSFLQVQKFHPVWYVRYCTASTVVPKYSPHLVHQRSIIRNRVFHTIFHVGRQWNKHVTTVKHYTLHFRSTLFFLSCPLSPVNARQHKVHNKVSILCPKKIRNAMDRLVKLSIIWKITPYNNLSNSEEWKNGHFYRKNLPPPPRVIQIHN